MGFDVYSFNDSYCIWMMMFNNFDGGYSYLIEALWLMMSRITDLGIMQVIS